MSDRLLVPSPKFSPRATIQVQDIAETTFEVDSGKRLYIKSDLAINMVLCRPSVRYIAGKTDMGMLSVEANGRLTHQTTIVTAMDGFCARYGISRPLLNKTLKCGSCGAPAVDIDAVAAGRWKCEHCGSVSVVMGALDYGGAGKGVESFKLRIPIQISRDDTLFFRAEKGSLPLFIRCEESSGPDPEQVRVVVSGLVLRDVR